MTTIAFVHAAATLLLAGVAWVVQIVVYPAFALVPRDAWERYHAAHSRAISIVVGPPWVAQVVTSAVLVIAAPGSLLVWADAVLVVAAIAATGAAVTVHGNLDPTADPGALRRLLRINLVRSLIWTAGSVTGLVVAAQAA
ncbi:hypothetical protein EV383_3575 [Pseudonocardia sediminis]|uniref:DUF1772 domain-containing protein n=1 Tax=Pseudonocardia sediminis TaxID=1397368 RepID=A0A4Q7UZW2_PSEST|nr:DUF1772 domain-containing protein [Pseudonocardia sediminis]RZT86678.1 hypothetical protein EV383_3575 [Pseudonocardia sediminis]